MWWRYAVGGAAVLAMGGAGWLLVGGEVPPPAVLPTASAQVAPPAQETEGGAPTLPEATPKTREEKRFGRYDKDRDGAITRDEYLLSRRKAYAKLDRDGDGRLSFDEWSVKTTTKFATADRDKSGAMNAAEFATTAVKRRPARRPACPPQQDDG
ncbi:EF-hand domain-containing protein [Sphingomonas lenta]|uniref:Histidine kinase n=1 Tax=Sphingomonas lenta TaxID=1141887 RepID=A0A2A2SH19_9SPHN|nr:EF-hand domain-containing protein [Sphingomonas lenta]PAX08470.1 histidine kinase [Sphingomonas lenta]